MNRVTYEDGTNVRFEYDGLGRKVRRLETYWQEKGQGKGPSATGLEHGQGFTQGQRNGAHKDKTNNGNGKGNGKGQAENPLKLREEDTAYLYDGLLVFQEFTGEGSPLGEYLRGNDQVASRKTFGFHGRKDEGREGNVRTRGGLMYYGYDGLGSVTDLTDRTGDVAMKYRYDAFGGLFTGITSPYNTVGYTGKSYDPKASLLEFYARWYDPSVGRFTTQDSYLGTLMAPASQHRYAYALNNPVTKVDRWGYEVPSDPEGSSQVWYGPYTRTSTETDSWTVSSTEDAIVGDYYVTYNVVTRYTVTYSVVTSYMKSNWGNIDELWTHRYEVSRSETTTRTVASRVWIGDDPAPPTGDDPSDPEDPGDPGDPSDPGQDPSPPGGGGGGGTPRQPTPEELAELNRLVALAFGPVPADEDPAIRLVQIQRFFQKYGQSAECTYESPYGCGQAVVDFTRWELTSQRLDPPGNYWNVVNTAMTQDMLNAENAYLTQLPDTGSRTGDLWLDFIHRASPETFWAAHSASLQEAHNSAAAQEALQRETTKEQWFINNVVVPAALTVGPEAMEHEAPRLLWDPSGPGVRYWVKNVYSHVEYEPPGGDVER